MEKISRERFKPIRDEVYDIIKNEILNGGYVPGERLIETETAKQLDVSRTPVREAFRKLEIDGLVEYVPNKGTVVAEVEKNEIKEIYQVRKVIETLIAEKAAVNISDELVDELKDNVERFKVATNYQEIIELAERFNNIISEASGYKKLVAMLTDIREYFKMVRVSNHLNPERRESAIEEHTNIANAIIARDAELAKKYTIEHIEQSEKFTL